MNWFERHLNWTIILGFWAQCLIIIMIGSFIHGEQPVYISISEIVVEYILGIWALGIFIPVLIAAPLAAMEFAYYMVYFLAPIALFFFICGWVLSQKKRRLWWLLLPCFIPLSWVVFLFLKNRRRILLT
jgi:hypothetical protein